MPVMLKLVVPTFVNVTVLAPLVVPIATVPKFKLAGESATTRPLFRLNVAITNLAAVMVTEQVPVPTQAPLQPAKVEPAAAAAVRATTVPLRKLAAHVVPQLMPVGLVVTVPLPLPADTTERLKLAWVGVSLNTTPQPIPQLPEMPAVEAVP